MAGKKQLPPVRIVGPSDEPAEPLSLSSAFVRGSRLNELMAKRRILISHIENENTLARDLAALMRQDNELSRQIEELEAFERERINEGGFDNDTSDGDWKSTAI